MNKGINIKDPVYHSEWMMLVSVAVLKFVIALFYCGYFFVFVFFLWNYVSYINPLINKVNYLIIFGSSLTIPIMYQVIMGIGLLYKKKWAQLISVSVSSLFIALFTIVMLIIIICIVLFVPFHLLVEKIGGFKSSLIIIVGSIYLFYIFSFYVGLPLYSIIVLRRDKVRKIFDFYDLKNKWCDKYTITEMSFIVFNLYFAVMSLTSLFYGLKFPFLGKIVSGTLSYTCYFLEFVILSSAVYFIIKKNIIGWSLSFFIHITNCVSAYLIFSKEAVQKLAKIYSNIISEQYFKHIPFEMRHYIDKSLQVCLFCMFLVIILYHLYLRKYYNKQKI